MLKINELTYSVENGIIFNKLNLHVEKNKIVTLLAPFGSGKSTLFNLICSNNADNGVINCYNNRVFYIPSVPIAVKGYSTAQNIKFYNKTIKDNDIDLVLEKVGLAGYGSHVPQLINSGFLFRLTIAIGLSLGSKLFLIDDAFNNMKNKSKIEIIDFLRVLLKNNDISIFFGTSNFLEAIFLSDKIYFAKAQPMEIVAQKDITNSNLTIKEKLINNDFITCRNEIEQEIKKHNLYNLIV